MKPRSVPESQFDLCSICGVYAELDDTEGVICYACAPDVYCLTYHIQFTSLHGNHHPNSRAGQQLRNLAYRLSCIAIELDEIEVELYNFRRSYGTRPDIAEAYNYLVEQEAELEADLYEIAPLYAVYH